MSLSAGTRLGPYELVALIGAGGMGEVYRARDTRLGREVAIKVLPGAFAGDADRRARFEREAKAVAALSHPNIVALFDTGVHDASLFLVTELLDGETLRERLTLLGGGTPLPVRKAIEIAVQIARGLAAAHAKGLVHRDLKPENVFLLADGQVKILDFGLAREITTGSGATETVAAMTDPGVVMGTVGYMAPEQVRGQPADARTDLFTLGAILYEMLSGQRAFRRDTAAETMTAILKEAPPELSAVRAELAPALARIVEHCLEKNPAERFQSARDVAFALETLSGSGTSTSGPASVVPLPRKARRVTIAALVIVGLAGATLSGLALGQRLFGRRTLPSIEAKTWDRFTVTNARFAPDGQTIVFSAAKDANLPELFVIRPATLTSESLDQPATHLLAISSKGELAVLTSVRFEEGSPRGTLGRMMMDGAPRPWLEGVHDADWSPDGSTLAIGRRVDGSDQLEYPIGRTLHQVPGYLSDVRVSPDGKRVAFFEHQIRGDNRGWVKIVEPDGQVRTLAGEYWGETGLAWSANGRFVYFSAIKEGAGGYRVFAANATGAPEPHVVFLAPGDIVVTDVAADGRMLTARSDSRISIRALLPGETIEREFGFFDMAITGSVSADGHFLLFSDESASAGPDYAIALRDTRGSRVVRLGPGFPWGLSPDGRMAGGVMPSTGKLVAYPTGVGDTLHIDQGAIEHYSSAFPASVQWLPDSRHILFCGNEQSKPPRCYTQQIPAGKAQPVTSEGVVSAWLAADGRTMLEKTTAGEYKIGSTVGASLRPVQGLTTLDTPLGWTAAGQIVVQANQGVPARVERVDPASGARKLLKEVAPPDRTGVTAVIVTQWVNDGQTYSYSYIHSLSKLFVIAGVAPD